MQKHTNFKVTFRNAVQIFILLIGIFVFTAITPAQTLKADYQFQGNLNSSVAGAPALTNLTGSGGANSFVSDTIDGYAKQSVRFPFNSGMAVNTAGLIPNTAYTIVMLFKVDEISGYRRVASFDNRTTDNGAYMLDGRLEFEATTNAAIFPNTYIQVVIVREASGRIRGYRDGSLRVDVANDGGAFQISSANILSFFQDDASPPVEASAGNVARIRLYDAPMTTTQVRLLERMPNVGGGDQPILFTTGRDGFNEIYSMNSDGSNQRRLTFNEITENAPKWSPDRSKIVYYRREISPAIDQIWIMDADGGNQTRLTNTTTGDRFPAWKPDGSKIIFSRCDAAGLCDLVTMNPDGSGQMPLPNVNTANDEYAAVYSSDGTKIVFACSINSTSFANQNICSANADGSNRQQITNTVSPVYNANPVYSPNGTKIAFERRSNSADIFTSRIYAMDSNGNNQTQLSITAVPDLSPSWSPDGTRLVFSSQRESVFTELYTMNATNGSAVTRLTTNSIGETPSDWYRPTIIARRTPFDFDGDGKSDVSVFRPTGGFWYLLNSASGFTGAQFGDTNDKIVPADYDGDGKTDLAVYRNGTWYLQRSTAGFTGFAFGAADDIPQPADFDGDGKADLAVWRPSNGTWYVFNLATNQFTSSQFGAMTDKPVVGDYDGDNKADYAVFRPSNGTWYVQRSQLGFTGMQFGDSLDKPVAADYDGDGKTDVVVFRPANGTWYLNRSQLGFTGIQFGVSTDLPTPADYDGDGKADVAVFRDGTWYLNRSTAGFTGTAFGAATDKPAPNAFVP